MSFIDVSPPSSTSGKRRPGAGKITGTDAHPPKIVENLGEAAHRALPATRRTKDYDAIFSTIRTGEVAHAEHPIPTTAVPWSPRPSAAMNNLTSSSSDLARPNITIFWDPLAAGSLIGPCRRLNRWRTNLFAEKSSTRGKVVRHRNAPSVVVRWQTSLIFQRCAQRGARRWQGSGYGATTPPSHALERLSPMRRLKGDIP